MGTINSAFSMMTSALDADQAALNIVSNNVANANTTGYTRQIPNWQENRSGQHQAVLRLVPARRLRERRRCATACWKSG